jgi:predicted RNase H-like HicB family nuclease
MNDMKRNLQYVLVEDDDAFVARCLDIEVASEGDTQIEAIANLREALELYFEDCPANLPEIQSRIYQLGEVSVGSKRKSSFLDDQLHSIPRYLKCSAAEIRSDCIRKILTGYSRCRVPIPETSEPLMN